MLEDGAASAVVGEVLESVGCASPICEPLHLNTLLPLPTFHWLLHANRGEALGLVLGHQMGQLIVDKTGSRIDILLLLSFVKLEQVIDFWFQRFNLILDAPAKIINISGCGVLGDNCRGAVDIRDAVRLEPIVVFRKLQVLHIGTPVFEMICFFISVNLELILTQNCKIK